MRVGAVARCPCPPRHHLTPEPFARLLLPLERIEKFRGTGYIGRSHLDADTTGPHQEVRSQAPDVLVGHEHLDI